MLTNHRFSATSRPSTEETLATQTQQMGNQEVTVTTHFDFNWDQVHFSVKVRTFRRRSITPHHQNYHHHSPPLLSYQKYEAIMSDPDFRNPEKYSGVDMSAYGFYKMLSNALKGNPSAKFHFYQNHSNNTVSLAVSQGMVSIPMKMGELQDIITPTTSENNLENLVQTHAQKETWKPRENAAYLNNQINNHHHHHHHNQHHLNHQKNRTPSPPASVNEDSDMRLSALAEDLSRHKSQYDTKISVIENQLSSMVQRLNTMDRSISDIKSDDSLRPSADLWSAKKVELMDEFSKIIDQKIAAMVKSCPAIPQTPVKNIQITKSKKPDLEPVLSTRSDSFYLSDFEEDKNETKNYAPWKDPEIESSSKTISSPGIGSNIEIQNHSFVKRYADVIKNSPYGPQIDLHKLWDYDTYHQYLVIPHQSEKYTLALTYNSIFGNCGGRVFLIHNYGGHVPEESLHYYRCLESHNFGDWRHNQLMKRLADLDAEYESRLSSRMSAIRYYTALEKIISAHYQ